MAVNGMMLGISKALCAFAKRSIIPFAALLVVVHASVVTVSAQQNTPGQAVENRATVHFADRNGSRDSAAASAVVTLMPGDVGRLILAKQVDRSFAGFGDTLRYTLKWRSIGTGTASNVVVMDTLPTGLAFVPGSATSQSFATSQLVTTLGNVVRIAVGDVAPGDSGSVTFSTVVGLPDGVIMNTAKAAYGSGLGADRDTAVSQTAATTVSEAAMRLDIAALTDHVMEIGDSITYRIRLINLSSVSTLRVASIVDTLPLALRFVSATGATLAGNILTGNILTWNIGSIAPSDTVVVFARALVTAPGTIDNRAVGHGSGLVDTATARIHANPQVATLRVQTLVDYNTVVLGDTLRYTLAFENRGNGVAGNVVLTDTLPESVTFDPAGISGFAGATWTITGRTLVIRLGDVAAGRSGAVQFRVATNDTVDIVNGAHATYEDRQVETAVHTNTVVTTVESVRMTLTLEAVTTHVLRVGDTLVYRLSVRNESEDAVLHRLTVTDSLPDELHFVSADPTPARSATSPNRPASANIVMSAMLNEVGDLGGFASWDVDSVMAKDSVVMFLTTTVRAVGTGQLYNSAAANGYGSKRVLKALAVAEATVDVDETSSLRIQKIGSALEAGTGDVVGYTLIVSNPQGKPVIGAVIHDLPMSGLQLQKNSIRGATYEKKGNELLFTIGDVPADGEVRIQYGMAVSGNRGDVLRNSAWAVAAGKPVSDTAIAAIRVRNIALTTRLIMGRVFLDENGDGRQQAKERPLSNAVIWGSHGESVRADSLGRFSFPDVNPGRYALRLDPLSVPPGYRETAPVAVRVDGWSTPSATFAVKRGPAILAEEKKAEEKTLKFGGLEVQPSPRFATPRDGAVLGSNRLFVRIEGAPGAAMDLFDGDSVIARSVLRPDGSEDLTSLAFKPGPHKLRAVMHTTTGDEEISISVHVSGEPASAVRADTASFHAGVPHAVALFVRDKWGVPVATKPVVTVNTVGVRVLDSDVDASSVGLQLPVSTDGRVIVRLQGDSAVTAKVTLGFGSSESTVPLNVLPEIRAFVLLADGEIGTGATTKSYGSIVGKGALDAHTSVTVTYDSRRNRDSQSFGGAFDPLDQSRYPILGDASIRNVMSSATSPLSMRVERDRSWLYVGDVDTRSFGEEGAPGSYHRALPGASARFASSLASITGFGSMVGQQIVQKQIRGNGSSGPYMIGGEVRLGTDRVVIETRDRLNATLVINRQELERFTDYDIDAATGSILLRRPLASSDGAGNPMMLVVLAEQLRGEQAFVGGVRGELQAAPVLHMRGLDSLRIGAGYVEDRSLVGGHNLMSGDIGTATQWGGTRIELARAATTDSAGYAMRASAWLRAGTRASARFEWNRVGEGFANPANPRLIAGTQDLRFQGEATLGAGWSVGGGYQRQIFQTLGADRAQSMFTVGRTTKATRLLLNMSMMDERVNRDTASISSTSLVSRLSYARDRNSLWAETTQPLRNAGIDRPQTYAFGSTYDVGHGIGLEAAQRFIRTDSTLTGSSTLALRSQFSTGTRAWTEYQLNNAVAGQTSSALIGIGQKLQVMRGLSVDAQFERRQGIGKLPETDPLRALPFTQPEANRWSASLGAEWAPSSNIRAGIRGELHQDDQTGRGHRIFASAEAAVTRSLTLLAREDAHYDAQLLSTGIHHTGATQSVLALAFRPSQRSDWNALAKIELRNDENPSRRGLGLLGGSDRRVIAALEPVWTPRTNTELSMRYAVRSSTVDMLGDGVKINGVSNFAGARIRQTIVGRLDVRGAGRLLHENNSGLTRYDLSPAVGVRLLPGLDLESGYRFGNLRDVDFAQNGGKGFYATLGMSITEKTGQSIADFWRNRIAGR